MTTATTASTTSTTTASAHARALIKTAESQLGYTEQPGGHTKFGHWYQATHATQPGYANAAWCDMFISWAATQTGQADAVGQFAWTPDHAQWYKDQGAWGGTPAPGAIVFFDWDGSDDIAAIDHVGLVKDVLGPATVRTIEGNIDDQVVTKIRDHATIVGYGYPDKVRQNLHAKAKAKAGHAKTTADGKTGQAGHTQTGQAHTQALALSGPTRPDPTTPADATAAAAGAALIPALLAAAALKRADLTGRLRRLRTRLRPREH